MAVRIGIFHLREGKIQMRLILAFKKLKGHVKDGIDLIPLKSRANANQAK